MVGLIFLLQLGVGTSDWVIMVTVASLFVFMEWISSSFSWSESAGAVATATTTGEKAAVKMRIDETTYNVGFYEREVEFAQRNHLNGSAMQASLDAEKRELKELRKKLRELKHAESEQM